MKKHVLKIITIIAGILILATLYINSSYYIKSQNWKYSDGNYIGDWLAKNSLKIEDRIIYAHKGKAKIVFCFMGRLTIENFETGERGTYINKS
jgi:hypothetical protein